MDWEVWCQEGSGLLQRTCPTYDAAIALACRHLWDDAPSHEIRGPRGFRMDRLAIMRECMKRASDGMSAGRNA